MLLGRVVLVPVTDCCYSYQERLYAHGRTGFVLGKGGLGFIFRQSYSLWLAGAILSLGRVVFAVGCIFITLSLEVLLKIGGSDFYLARLRMNQPLLGV